MRLILMEAGPQVIIVNADSGQYFMLNVTVWQGFHQASIDSDAWQQGLNFILPKPGEQFSDNSVEPSIQKTMGDDVAAKELIARFIDLDRNSGAMIAKRDLGGELSIIDKRRYKKLRDQYDT